MTHGALGRAISASLLVVACGGANPEAKAPEDRETADFRAGSVKSCLTDESLEAFCACSVDGLIAKTTPEERKNQDPKLEKVAEESAQACAEKIPEAFIKKQFVAECSASSALPNFCGCSYDFYKAKGLLEASEAEVASKQGELGAACGDALFLDTKNAFLLSCETKASKESCGCLFSKLEARFGQKKLLEKFGNESAELRTIVESLAGECK